MPRYNRAVQIELAIENYRCFSADAPAKLVLQPGFTSLIGTNNSGKSTLLKFFFEFRSIFELLLDDNSVQSLLRGLNQGLRHPPYVYDTEELFFNGNADDIRFRISLPEERGAVSAIEITVLRNAQFSMKVLGREPGNIPVSDNMRVENGVFHSKATAQTFDFKYIRGAVRQLHSTFYVPAFRHITAFQPSETPRSSDEYYDILVGQPFIEFWANSQLGRQVRERQKVINLVRTVGKVFGIGDLNVNVASDRNSVHVVADGKPYQLQELGSGFSQFLLVMLNALRKTPAYILIDEPELNMHPSLQLDLLTTLRAAASEGVVFATHNLGLARQVSDQMYATFRRQGSCRVQPYSKHPNLAEFLGGLQFGAFELAGVEKVLLVEGRHEVLTLMELLRHYDKEHKVVLIPMGGSEWINKKSKHALAQVMRITPRVLALVDSERTAAGENPTTERRDFQRVCDRLGITCQILERAAIENYFPERAVKAALGQQFQALTEFQKLEQLNPRWGKSQNWEVARQVTRAELDGTDLGNFLAAL